MLVTNGCSFVWGDELDGYETNEHHHLTFAHQLAERIGVEYKNLATCGACNNKIFRDTIDYIRKHENITHMVIIWSAWQRDEVSESHPPEYEDNMKIQRWQCQTQISPSRLHFTHKKLSDVLEPYYKAMNVERNGIIKTLSYMHAIGTLCEVKGIKLLQGGFHERMWVNYLDCFTKFHNKGKNWGEYNLWIKSQMDDLPDHYRIGLGKYVDLFKLAREKYSIKPFGHPDESAHEEYAHLLHHIFLSTYE